MSEAVIIERIDNLRGFFKEEFAVNKEDHQEIKRTMRQFHDDHEKRIRAIENWKLVFVAKYSVYSGIALFCGSMVATLGLKLLSKYL